MMKINPTHNDLRHTANMIAANYRHSDVPLYGTALHLPEKEKVIEVLRDLQKLLFPAYFGDEYLIHLPPEHYTALLLEHIRVKLCNQIRLASLTSDESPPQTASPEEICIAFLNHLPQIQNLLEKDLTANFEGDPAASSKQEVLFSYPGFYAIFVYRIAHELHRHRVPLIPRMMTEYAHSRTGIDIHPGAVIGEYFLIDHGTGIVIGETTIIGDRVRLYQGTTLGALSPRVGQTRESAKRHPTVGNNVTIYSGATILGGNTLIGDNAVIGGNVFLTKSVANNTRVTLKSPELSFRGLDPED